MTELVYFIRAHGLKCGGGVYGTNFTSIITATYPAMWLRQLILFTTSPKQTDAHEIA